MVPDSPQDILTKEQADVIVENYHQKGSTYELAEFFRSWQSART